MTKDRIIQLTEDGSHTILLTETNVTYHSKHGAIQESMHVFICAGLHYFINESKRLLNEPIKIFEVGLGTGLNTLLSLQEAIQRNQKVVYQTIEPYSLSFEEFVKLNYTSLINVDLKQSFVAMHTCEWNKEILIHPLFSLKKIKIGLQQFETEQKFHIIYFDAFDPNTQPELWTETIFNSMYDLLETNGILVTYCSKGIVRKAMQAAGFSVKKLHGPKGKREIVRAIKN